MSTSIKKNRVFILVTLLLIVIAQECALRLLFPFPEVLNFNRVDYSGIHVHSQTHGPRYLANASFTWTSAPDDARSVHHLNLYGFRDRTWPLRRNPDEPQVMFVGDSFVEGFMTTVQGSLPQMFERIARDSGTTLGSMNLGVAANQGEKHFELIRDAVPIFEPTHLILVFFANDFPLPNFEPDWLSPSLTPQLRNPYVPHLLQILIAILEHRTIPRAWHSRPFPFLRPVPHLSNLMSNPEKATAMRKIVEPDLVVAMQKGRFNSHVINEHESYKTFLRHPFEVVEPLRALKAFTLRHGSSLFIAYLPSRSQISDAYLPFQAKYNHDRQPTSLMPQTYQLHATLLKQSCRSLDLPFLDLTPILRDVEARGQRLFWNYDEHLKPHGYELVAENIFHWWNAAVAVDAPN